MDNNIEKFVVIVIEFNGFSIDFNIILYDRVQFAVVLRCRFKSNVETTMF